MVSSRPRTYSTEGIVVRVRDLGEADRLVTVLTLDRGIVRCVARSARKPGSRTGGHLDLLRHVSISVREGRTLDSVSQADTVEGYRKLRGDLKKMSHGSYMAELTERLSAEGASNPSVFRLLAESLQSLQDTESAELLTRWFELRALDLTGFAPQLDRCVETGEELDQRDHLFSSELGGLVSADARPPGAEGLLPAGVNTIKLLRFLSRSRWEQVEKLSATPEDLRPVERILRSHIQHVLDRSLRSASFVEEVRSWESPGREAGLE